MKKILLLLFLLITTQTKSISNLAWLAGFTGASVQTVFKQSDEQQNQGLRILGLGAILLAAHTHNSSSETKIEAAAAYMAGLLAGWIYQNLPSLSIRIFNFGTRNDGKYTINILNFCDK